MEETTTAQAGNETQSTSEDKTFTQAEVNKIVQERVLKEKAKYEGFADLKEKAAKFDALEEQSKTELRKAQEKADKLQKELDGIKTEKALSEMRSKVATDTGVPAELLTGENEEACVAQAQAILSFASTKGYPSVRDGGETLNVGKPSVSQQFANWFNEQT